MALISVEFILPLEMYFRVKTLYGYIHKKIIRALQHVYCFAYILYILVYFSNVACDYLSLMWSFLVQSVCDQNKSFIYLHTVHFNKCVADVSPLMEIHFIEYLRLYSRSTLDSISLLRNYFCIISPIHFSKYTIIHHALDNTSHQMFRS